MCPILLRLGPISIHTYGVLIALAFFLGMTLASHRAERVGQDPQLIMDLAFYLMVAAIVGSRILYVILDYRVYMQEPLRILKIWEGGLVFYGGLIAAIIVGASFMRRHRMSFWPTADILAPSIALGQAIGRLGCLAAGCCYGLPTERSWGVIFTNPEALAPLGIRLHPSQIYESLAALTIFLFLLIYQRQKRFSGQIFLSYVSLYALARFFLEFFRGDYRGSLNILSFSLSTSQIISLLGIVISLVLFRARTPKRRY